MTKKNYLLSELAGPDGTFIPPEQPKNSLIKNITAVEVALFVLVLTFLYPLSREFNEPTSTPREYFPIIQEWRPFIPEFITEQNAAHEAFLALWSGLIIMLTGLFGVYYLAREEKQNDKKSMPSVVVSMSEKPVKSAKFLPKHFFYNKSYDRPAEEKSMHKKEDKLASSDATFFVDAKKDAEKIELTHSNELASPKEKIKKTKSNHFNFASSLQKPTIIFSHKKSSTILPYDKKYVGKYFDVTPRKGANIEAIFVPPKLKNTLLASDLKWIQAAGEHGINKSGICIKKISFNKIDVTVSAQIDDNEAEPIKILYEIHDSNNKYRIYCAQLQGVLVAAFKGKAMHCGDPSGIIELAKKCHIQLEKIDSIKASNSNIIIKSLSK